MVAVPKKENLRKLIKCRKGNNHVLEGNECATSNGFMTPKNELLDIFLKAIVKKRVETLPV